MPYIDLRDRPEIDCELPDVGDNIFTLATAIEDWFDRVSPLQPGYDVYAVYKMFLTYSMPLSFDSIFDVRWAVNIVVGSLPEIVRSPYAQAVMDCAWAEYYRRIVAPYEDRKIELNGDVT